VRTENLIRVDEVRESPLCSRFIHTIRRTCEVDGRAVGIEWCLDFNQVIENSGTIIIVGYGAREASLAPPEGSRNGHTDVLDIKATGGHSSLRGCNSAALVTGRESSCADTKR
jgi:hypothetical protein